MTIPALKLFIRSLLAVGLVACQPRPSRSQPGPVPAEAPRSAPRSLWDPSNHMRDSLYICGTFLKDIVVILFKPEATQPEREAAVRLISGEVVGGRPFARGDGYYFVRIPGDGTTRPLLEALRKLDTLPQVLSASPEFVDSGLRL